MPKCDVCEGGGIEHDGMHCPACNGTGWRRWSEVAAELREHHDRAVKELGAERTAHKVTAGLLAYAQRERDEEKVAHEATKARLYEVQCERDQLVVEAQKRATGDDAVLARYDGAAGEEG